MMSAMSLSQLAQACEIPLQEDALFQRVCTDSRQLHEGDLFVALSGDNFDGNQFVAAAAEKGAVAAVVDSKPAIEIPYLQVKDTRVALGLVARCNRQQFKGPLLALTGSAGKTTTKEMLAAILSQLGETLATQGNFNNEIGVPQTLLQLAPEHRFAVIEMGAAKPGDIEYLCQFAEPDIALVTNVMAAHMAGFGSLDNVAKTKGEIFSALGAKGTAIINLDSPFYPQWCQQSKAGKQQSFSLENPAADVYARAIQPNAGQGVSFILCTQQGEASVQLSLLGRHNVGNALAAAAMALVAGASLKQVVAGLESVVAVPGRLQLLPSNAGFELIDDSYNANPGAVEAAIDMLAEFGGQRGLVLGDMAELAEHSVELHREIGAYAKAAGIDRLWAVGDFADEVVAGFGGHAQAYRDLASLQENLTVLDGMDVVLVKGSRSAGMERMVETLTKKKNMGSND